jgi:hypothetical protein
VTRTDRTEDYLGHMIEAIDRALSYVTPFASAAAFAQDQ